MNDFKFFTPTRYIFGKDAQKNAGTLSKELLGERVLLVYGRDSAKSSGLLDQIEGYLQQSGIKYHEFGGIQPNPTDRPVRAGISLCRDKEITGLLAVGGGSVIDTAKAIAAGVLYDGDFWDFYSGKSIPKKALPIGVVLTIPAAGSEGSGNSVITKEDGLRKVSIRTDYVLRPKFALLNPELTFSLPPYQTACGIVDMIAHILERYFTPTEGADVSDRISEGIIKSIIEAAPVVMRNPDDYTARANIMWAGTLAHNGLCGCGKIEDWASHGLEHEISALYNVAHGAGLSVILLAYMRYMLPIKPQRIADLGRSLFAADKETETEAAKTAIEKFEEFFKSIGMPVNFAQLGIPDPDIELMVEKVHQNKGKVFGAYYPVTPDVSRAIYKLAL